MTGFELLQKLESMSIEDLNLPIIISLYGEQHEFDDIYKGLDYDEGKGDSLVIS